MLVLGQLAEFGFVDLLEQRALVPLGTTIALECTCQFAFRDVQELKLQRSVGFRLMDQVVDTTPGTLELLKLRSVNDLVDLLAQFFVQLRDHFIDRVVDVVLDDRLVGQP